MDVNDYLTINRKSWNARVDAHLNSDFYQNDSFLKGRNSLNSIELELLGDVQNLDVLHLQCHFGQDTISLARLGARPLGVDLSDKAIHVATEMARQLDSEARFLCCDVFDVPSQVEEKFDLVFSSYGTIGWLPDIDKWATVVKHMLKPGGRFVFAEFHPVVWMFDDDFKTVAYSYFHDQAIIEEIEGTYAAKDTQTHFDTITWNHGLSEVISSLLKAGLTLKSFNEFNYAPYDCLNGMVEIEPGKYQIEKWGNKLPLVYALEMTNPA